MTRIFLMVVSLGTVMRGVKRGGRCRGPGKNDGRRKTANAFPLPQAGRGVKT
jgi:hypothetical protein